MCPISLTGGVSVIGWVNKGSFRKIEDGKKNINESIMRARRLQIQHTHTGTHSLHSFYQNEAFIASWGLSVQIFVTSFSVAFTAALSFYHLIQDVEQDVGLISRQSVFNLNLPVQRNSHAIKDQLRPNGIVSLSPVWSFTDAAGHPVEKKESPVSHVHTSVRKWEGGTMGSWFLFKPSNLFSWTGILIRLANPSSLTSGHVRP